MSKRKRGAPIGNKYCLGRKVSLITREKLRHAQLGKKHTEVAKRKMSLLQRGNLNHRFGVKHSDESRAKMRISASYGEDNHSWKGGVSSMNHLIRTLPENLSWRNKVFIRDKWTCQECFITGVKFHADHIILFSEIITKHNIKTTKEAIECKDLWDVDNGRTLCIPCHEERHKKH